MCPVVMLVSRIFQWMSHRLQPLLLCDRCVLLLFRHWSNPECITSLVDQLSLVTKSN